MGAIASQITSFTIVYSTVYSGVDQRKHQSSASLAFVRGIHRWPVNSPHNRPVTRKIFPFDDVIMFTSTANECCFGVIDWCDPMPALLLRYLHLHVMPISKQFNRNLHSAEYCDTKKCLECPYTSYEIINICWRDIIWDTQRRNALFYSYW